MLVSFSNKVLTKLETNNILIENAESTINYVLTGKKHLVSNYERIDVDGVGNSEVRKSFWGVLKVIQYKVKSQDDVLQGTLFIENEVKDSTVLLMSKNDKVFHLGGKSVIVGDIRVPFKEVDELNLPGYEYKLSHKGYIKESISELPEPRKFFKEINFIDVSENRIHEETVNSFFNKTKKVKFSLEGIENLNLRGRFVLESDQKIFLRKNNRLEDVIVKAPVVEIEEGFKGNLQIFATEKVIVNKNVDLNYPSIIYVSGGDKNVEIKIGEKCKVLGLVLGVSDKERESKILISDNTIIAGDLYCSGQVEFKGTMYGAIYVNEFHLKTEESEYKNALLNLKLYKLPKFFQRINAVEVNNISCRIIKNQE
ncbi:hypothetical protein KUL156_28150 [Alteromonas sp. KUL156]|nr:hypothetical protein KUL154_02910 [Alteromonas sp. KUL154]GFE00223.1 hypothetical protein KUL156_28150 [Alteromonas sp. KUL156]